MNVEIGTVAVYFLFWEYFNIVSLQCGTQNHILLTHTCVCVCVCVCVNTQKLPRSEFYSKLSCFVLQTLPCSFTLLFFLCSLQDVFVHVI
jgi:hypothetical protein